MAKNRFTFLSRRSIAKADRVSRFTLGIGLAALSLCWSSAAVTVTEDFSSDPLQNGWAIFGDTNLFQWDSTNQTLDVTWDSSQVNSYFYRPLGTTLGMADDFTVDFDIELNDIQWTNTLQLAIGLLNFTNAADPGFSRVNGFSPNIFEFDYFPEDPYGNPNIEAAMTDAAAITNYPDFYFIYDTLPITPGTTYHVSLAHAAGEPTITGKVFANGEIYTTMPIVGDVFGEVIGDFAFDTVAVMNYSGAGQDTNYPVGTILAHGTVDNFVVCLPPAVRNLTGAFSNNVWQVQFNTYSNWFYTLQRSTDLTSWNDASTSVPGSGDAMSLCDTNALGNQSFYHIHAQQP